ncbi:MAG: 2-oxoacid:acceptor oxidoreductase family protein [Myxococcota bacterium]|jgi:2-oxoisovalerate ferredoxin oxidoreductase beta subunit|nr:2-oxoacid:acceptor oxidoreductase family protein [Myxococcota bacterium]
MKIIEKASAFYDVFERKTAGSKKATHYCPGCGHGNIHKMIAEALTELGVAERSVLVSPVGCSVFAYYYFDVGNYQAPHGRAAAVATGIKRANPHAIVMSYQGDGDLAAIGTAETVHAANRGENITVFFVNNAIYGMTGGQMAPTTLIGQRSTTSPLGRLEHYHGNPVRVCEILATLPAPTYIERVAIGHAKHLTRARKAIKKALQNQVEGRGYSFVEILAPCPTGWKMDPPAAREWMLEEMTKVFPLGVFKDEGEHRDAEWFRKCDPFDPDAINTYLGSKELEAADETLPLPYPLQCKFAGFGGQGVLTLGLFLSQVGLHAGHHVSWIPSYGPEMRGGTANCQVNISSKRIGSPVVDHPNVLVVMNEPSLQAFQHELIDDGLMIVDTTLVESKAPERVRAVYLPASQMADECGTAKVANVVILGALCAATGAFPPEFVEKTIRRTIKKKHLLDVNLAALKKGYEFVQAQKS